MDWMDAFSLQPKSVEQLDAETAFLSTSAMIIFDIL